MKVNKNSIFFAGTIILVLFDQLTKLYIKGFDFMGIHAPGMVMGDSISIIGDFMRITYIENKGMAFGIEFGAGKIFLSLFSIIASIGLIIYMQKIKDYSAWLKAGIMFVLAGALGNLVDRVFYGIMFGQAPIFYGSVVDFIQVDIPDIDIAGLYYTHWPVFNIADACVTIGVIFLLLFHKKIPEFREVFPKRSKEAKPTDVQ